MARVLHRELIPHIVEESTLKQELQSSLAMLQRFTFLHEALGEWMFFQNSPTKRCGFQEEPK